MSPSSPDTQPARVLLLFGGDGAEREVSIASARSIASALTAETLDLIPARWDEGGWVVLPDADDLHRSGTVERPLACLERLIRAGVEVVFNALHGGPGEDGRLAALCELAGLPYTGAGVHAGAVTDDKSTFRTLAIGLGLEVAPGASIDAGAWFTRADEILTHVATDVGFPAIVKPVHGGSSCGVVKVEDAEGLAAALDRGFADSRELLVERFIVGRELTVPCLGTRPGIPPETLPLIEIQPKTESGFFDYEAKYVKGRADEICPAPIEADLAEHLGRTAREIHLQLDLGGCSRTDLILSPDGPVWLETQTVPGFTETSLLPQAAAAAGIPFPTLCRRLIDYAISAHLWRRSGEDHVA
ncbi:MAG: D-alanine--D-alanine ligase family protein [Planctomycetota bacterium]|jgi:D-alanine-D-alanine ligase